MKRAPLAERLWPRVHVTRTCWLWQGGKDTGGYGMIGLSGKTTDRAHRAAWLLSHGWIPRGMHVLHHCDTPACVNPDHLFLGTPRDNMADRDRKGRTARGESQREAGRRSWIGRRQPVLA